jgi:hypothetical protein
LYGVGTKGVKSPNCHEYKASESLELSYRTQ